MITKNTKAQSTKKESAKMNKTKFTSRSVTPSVFQSRFSLGFVLFVILSSVLGCIQHRVQSDPVEVKPIKVEPIHITVDVNVRVQERLDRFFAFEEEIEQEVLPAPGPQPQ